MKGTPELATGTRQLIFLVKLKGVEALMLAESTKKYLN
jgi:hypothetical protein